MSGDINKYSFVFIGSTLNEVRANGSTYSVSNPFTSKNTWYKTEIYINKNSSTNNVIFKVDDVAIKTISTTISSISSPSFNISNSNYNYLGLSYTDIVIKDN